MRLSPCLTVLVMLVGCGGAVEPREAPADGQVRIASDGCGPLTVVDCGCGVCYNTLTLCPILPDCEDGTQPPVQELTGADDASEPAVSQQGPTSQPYYTCTEDACPPGYCMTGVVRSTSCPGGVAWVCNDMRYYACI